MTTFADISDYLDGIVEDETWGDAEDLPQRKDLAEGGDYHLVSALKSFQDYRSDPIFRKEEGRVKDILGDHVEEMDSISTLLFFWSLACSKVQINKNHIIRDMNTFGLNELDTRKVGKMVATELGVLYDYDAREMVEFRDAVRITVNRVVSRLTNLRNVVNLVVLLLILKNSIKNMRYQDIRGFEGMNSVEMVNGVICCTVEPDFQIMMSTDVMGLSLGEKDMIIPINYFLQAADKIQERYNVLIYTSVMHEFIPGVTPSCDELLEIMRIGDDHLKDRGNDGYSLISNYEAIVVGVLLSRDDPLLVEDPDEFLNILLKDMDVGEKASAGKWITIFKSMNEDKLSDVHGLYRIFGHPVIDIEGGILKMQDVSLSRKYTDILLGVEVARKFKEMFFTTYRKRHGFYPPHTFKPNSDKESYLMRCLESNDVINTDFMSYKLYDWDEVESGKCFEIPHSWNVIHTVKDKAISPNRDELYNNLISRGHVFNMDLRRVVLKTMSTKVKPMRTFLMDVAKNGLSTKFLIIGIYPKEREIKIKPRFFSLMSYELRLYVTSSEDLLNEKLLKYFPQITMSLNLLEMQKKMGVMSGDQKDQEQTVTYVINMDFIKWNQQMRYSICTGVFKEIDKLFGLPGLIDQTHKIFEGCTIYLSSGDRKLLPHPKWGVKPDGKYVWTGDGSGKEGLRQKGWTIMTDCDIMYVADKFHMDVSLVGGGDNQVLTVKFRSRDIDETGRITDEGKVRIKSKMKGFTDALQDHFDRRGLPLKSSETWTSTCLFAYNKHMYYKGRQLRSVLKQISRCFPFANASIMSTALMCNSVSTILKAAMQKEIHALGILTMKSLWACDISHICLNLNPLFLTTKGSLTSGAFQVVRDRRPVRITVTEEHTEDFWLKLWALPSILGGPGLANCFNLTMRGFPDQLTEAIHFMTRLQQKVRFVDPTWADKIRKMLGCSFSVEPKMEKLVEDPMAISHDAPPHSTSALREKAREAISGMIEGDNSDMIELLSVPDKDREQEFYNALCSGEELDPKAYHEIAKSSLYGFSDSLLSRIDKTKTLLRLNETLLILFELAEAEWRFLGWMLIRDDIEHDVMFVSCSRVSADRIRRACYGKRVLGVTVPHPSEYLSVSQRGDHHCTSGHILIRDDGSSFRTSSSVLGNCKPYYGSYTRERFKATDIASAYGDENLLKRVINLQKLVGWRYPRGSKFANLIKAAFSAVTNADPELMWVDERLIRGSYDHRRNVDSNTHGGIPNFLLTPSTHISMSTSSWTEHSRSGKNETIHFQACLIVCVLRMMKIQSSRSHELGKIVEFHAHEVCNTCITELDDIDTQKTQPKRVVKFPTLVGNSLVYMYHEDVKMDYHRVKKIEESRELEKCMIDGYKDKIPWNTYDEGSDLVSTMLFLDMIGSGSSASPSFFLLARDKCDVTRVLEELLKKIRAWKDLLGEGETVVRSTKTLDIFCDTVSGYKARADIMEWSSEGRLEGKTNSIVRDIEPSIAHWFGCMVNPVLGSATSQIILSWLGRYPVLRWCPRCCEVLRSSCNLLVQDVTKVTLCSVHSCLNMKVMINPSHPDNIIKSTIRQSEILARVRPLRKTEVAIYRYNDRWEDLMMPEVDVLSVVAEGVDSDLWGDILSGWLLWRNNRSILIGNDIFDLGIISRALDYFGDTSVYTVYVMIEELSASEVGAIVEKVGKTIHRTECPVVPVYDETSIPEETILILSPRCTDTMTKYVPKCQAVLMSLSSVLKLDKGIISRVSSWSCPIRSHSIGNVGVLELGKMAGPVNYSCFRVAKEKTEFIPRGLLSAAGEASGCFTTTRFIYHLAKKCYFESQFDLIVVTERLKKGLGRMSRFLRGRQKSTTAQRLMVGYFVSLLSHCEEADAQLVGKIKLAKYHVAQARLTVSLRGHFVKSHYVDLFSVLRAEISVRPNAMTVPSLGALLEGVNLLGGKGRGFNVTGS